MRLNIPPYGAVTLHATHPSSGRELGLHLERDQLKNARLSIKGVVGTVRNGRSIQVAQGALVVFDRAGVGHPYPIPADGLDIELRGSLFDFEKLTGIKVPSR
jgi:hypothetical protein